MTKQLYYVLDFGESRTTRTTSVYVVQAANRSEAVRLLRVRRPQTQLSELIDVKGPVCEVLLSDQGVLPSVENREAADRRRHAHVAAQLLQIAYGQSVTGVEVDHTAIELRLASGRKLEISSPMGLEVHSGFDGEDRARAGSRG